MRRGSETAGAEEQPKREATAANVFRGRLVAPGGRLAIVVSRYHETITARLLDGALTTFREHDVPDDSVDVAWVPGAFEIPTVAGQMARAQRYAAVLCLGAVIRGETTHDAHINRAVSTSLTEIATHSGVPVLFGVLTCDTLEQAVQRSGGEIGNKGAECAEAALEMVSLLAQLPS